MSFALSAAGQSASSRNLAHNLVHKQVLQFFLAGRRAASPVAGHRRQLGTYIARQFHVGVGGRWEGFGSAAGYFSTPFITRAIWSSAVCDTTAVPPKISTFASVEPKPCNVVSSEGAAEARSVSSSGWPAVAA